nr:sulfotransferase [Persicimonas caeni]
MDSVREVMRGRHWDPDYEIPWERVRLEWEKEWDSSKEFLLEKSPPNLLRAAAIQEHFEPAYFIGMIRNPYAFCEGVARRPDNDMDVASAAEFWLQCAQAQTRNKAELDHILFFTYEEFAEDPAAIRDRILEFLPELECLDLDEPSDHSFMGHEPIIRNLNPIQIRRLTSRDIARINRVLRREPQLMADFGYDFIEPSLAQTIGSLKAKASSYALRAARFRGILPGPIVRRIEKLVLE